MQLRIASLFCVFGLVLGGCVTTSENRFAAPTDYVPMDQIQIQNRFDTVEVNAATLGLEAHRCVAPLNAGSASITQTANLLPLPRGTMKAMMHVSSASALIVVGSSAICIQQSSAHYPIFAGEAFAATVNPSGVPPSVTDGWYAQIAKRLAEEGRVSVAYVFKNGNANIANYWVETSNKYALNYTSEFKKAGSWETGTYDFRFSDPNLNSVSVTKRNNASRKSNLIENR